MTSFVKCSALYERAAAVGLALALDTRAYDFALVSWVSSRRVGEGEEGSTMVRLLRSPRAALCALLATTAAVAIGAPARAATDPDTRARAIVQQMTLDEKVLELHGIGGSSPDIRKV